MQSRERNLKLCIMYHDMVDESLSSDVATAVQAKYKTSHSPKVENNF